MTFQFQFLHRKTDMTNIYFTLDKHIFYASPKFFMILYFLRRIVEKKIYEKNLRKEVK